MRLIKFAASALLAAAPLSAAPPPPSSIAAAVASPSRNPDNVKLDEGRKPAQVLKFLGLKPGMNVLDLFGANAYWAEMTAPVVGPKGHVTVWMPSQFYSDKGKASFATFMASHPNVSIVTSPFEAPDLPAKLCRLGDPQRQLSRHLLAEREVQDPADGPAMRSSRPFTHR